ncbi:MAG: hypothetical protein M2R45_04694 [Verrucomicrobia subdivision 3 bacterium]|nr:hypothetical protein [Limisphaerales bacterium]MCS1416283.1 hypothetical protein [Limisphaerales bacterium]
MRRDNIQSQRFEFKYIVSEDTATAIRDFVQSYLVIDEYGATLPNLSYLVHSLYLDSPDLKLYQTTINGDKNRFKLRLRFYENRPQAPVYFEIKRRLDNTISKKRAGIARDAVDTILAGQLPSPEQVVTQNPNQHQAIREFCQMVSTLNAIPIAHVAYLREAWISEHDNTVRMTIDRDVRCEPEPSAELKTTMSAPVRVFGDFVVLELKFTSRFPDWFKELVRVYGLTQCGAAKYVDGATLIGPDQLGVGGGLAPQPMAFDTSFSATKISHLKRREQILLSVS